MTVAVCKLSYLLSRGTLSMSTWAGLSSSSATQQVFRNINPFDDVHVWEEGFSSTHWRFLAYHKTEMWYLRPMSIVWNFSRVTSDTLKLSTSGIVQTHVYAILGYWTNIGDVLGKSRFLVSNLQQNTSCTHSKKTKLPPSHSLTTRYTITWLRDIFLKHDWR